MTEEQKAAEKMRRVSLKEHKEIALTESKTTPANYLPPSVINSISSVKKDKTTFETLIAKTLLDIIMNGENNKEKMAAIDRYQKLTSSSQLFIKSGNKTTAIDAPSGDTGSTINVNFSSHLQSDEPEEEMKIASRDLVKEKNDKLFSQSGPSSPVGIEDADFEVIDG